MLFCVVEVGGGWSFLYAEGRVLCGSTADAYRNINIVGAK